MHLDAELTSQIRGVPDYLPDTSPGLPPTDQNRTESETCFSPSLNGSGKSFQSLRLNTWLPHPLFLSHAASDSSGTNAGLGPDCFSPSHCPLTEAAVPSAFPMRLPPPLRSLQHVRRSIRSGPVCRSHYSFAQSLPVVSHLKEKAKGLTGQPRSDGTPSSLWPRLLSPLRQLGCSAGLAACP